MWRGFAYQLGKQSVADESRGPNLHYRAFISYSHRDDVAAQSLHKRLETYRLPNKLVGQETPRGAIPDKLTPIFRDLDELSAADNLSTVITEALAKSDTLIVLASPGAKASRWVNLEIESFRALHGDTRPVLVALIEGEPDEAFPAALTADGHEPVAADFRGDRGARRLALLKLVAGMTGVGLDQLVQRDAQRQNRRVMAVTLGAIIAVLVMALLLAAALRAQSEAERQRQAAEGLVEYMLTDLRDKLKGVGRLDVMTAVNERAMKYYGGESVEGQLLKARTLHALGEDDERRGDLNLALTKFEEAHRTTTTILKSEPSNRDAILAQAQSQFWLGYANQKQGNYEKSILYYQDQLSLLEKINVKYKNDQFLKLKSAAYKSIGTIYFNNFKNNKESLIFFQKYRDTILNNKYSKANIYNSRLELSDAYAWVADAYAETGNIYEAELERRKQASVLDALLQNDPANQQYLWARTGADRAIFRLCYRAKRNQCARDSIAAAERRLTSTSHDGKDTSWIWIGFYVRLDQAFMALRLNNCKGGNYFSGLASELFESYRAKSSKYPADIIQMKMSRDALRTLTLNQCL